jgi:hypothetical protein
VYTRKGIKSSNLLLSARIIAACKDNLQAFYCHYWQGHQAQCFQDKFNSRLFVGLFFIA